MIHGLIQDMMSLMITTCTKLKTSNWKKIILARILKIQNTKITKQDLRLSCKFKIYLVKFIDIQGDTQCI